MSLARSDKENIQHQLRLIDSQNRSQTKEHLLDSPTLIHKCNAEVQLCFATMARENRLIAVLDWNHKKKTNAITLKNGTKARINFFKNF